MNPVNQVIKTQNNDSNLVNGELPKNKPDIKKVQTTGSQSKMEIKEENSQNQSIIK